LKIYYKEIFSKGFKKTTQMENKFLNVINNYLKLLAKSDGKSEITGKKTKNFRLDW